MTAHNRLLFFAGFLIVFISSVNGTELQRTVAASTSIPEQIKSSSQKKLRYFIELEPPKSYSKSNHNVTQKMKLIERQQHRFIANLQLRIPGITAIDSFQRYQNLIVVELSKDELLAVKGDASIEQIHRSYDLKINVEESKSVIGLDSVIEQNGMDDVDGSGIKIAIIDTGIDYNHTDLGGCFGEGCKVADGYDFINDDADPMDDHLHGTHVAGIAAANGEIVGIAPNATLYALKACDAEGFCPDYAIMNALEWAMDPDENPTTDDAADVINLSLGSRDGSPDSPLTQLVNTVVTNGIMVVVAAGNDGPMSFTIGTPANAKHALSVAAYDSESRIADFSSRGFIKQNGNLKPEIAAPGVGINSTVLNNDYAAYSGTSMAAPIISGLSAILLQKYPEISVTQLKSRLVNTATDLGENYVAQGNGLVDFHSALNAELSVSQPIVSLGWIEDILGTEIIRQVTIENHSDIAQQVRLTLIEPENSSIQYQLSDDVIDIAANSTETLDINITIPSDADRDTNNEIVANLFVSGSSEIKVPLVGISIPRIKLDFSQVNVSELQAFSKKQQQKLYLDNVAWWDTNEYTIPVEDETDQVAIIAQLIDVDSDYNTMHYVTLLDIAPSYEPIVLTNNMADIPVDFSLPLPGEESIEVNNGIQNPNQIFFIHQIPEYGEFSTAAIWGFGKPERFYISKPVNGITYDLWVHNDNENVFSQTAPPAITIPLKITESDVVDDRVLLTYDASKVKEAVFFVNNHSFNAGIYGRWRDFLNLGKNSIAGVWETEPGLATIRAFLLEHEHEDHLYLADDIEFNEFFAGNYALKTPQFWVVDGEFKIGNIFHESFDTESLNSVSIPLVDNKVSIKLGFLQPWFRGAFQQNGSGAELSYGFGKSSAFFADSYLNFFSQDIEYETIENGNDPYSRLIFNDAKQLDNESNFRPSIFEISSDTYAVSQTFNGFKLGDNSVSIEAEASLNLSLEDGVPPVMDKMSISTNGSEHVYLANGRGTIEFEFSDDSEMSDISMFYRLNGDEDWITLAQSNGGNSLSIEIDDIANGIYDLMVSATDVHGNNLKQTTIPAFIAEQGCRYDNDCDGVWDVFENNDPDGDGDGVLDELDAFPNDATEYLDTDGDGIGNNADADDDGDGVVDSEDAFPLDAMEALDTDGDGIGDNADNDRDGDGVVNDSDCAPLNSQRGLTCNFVPFDFDGDGSADIALRRASNYTQYIKNSSNSELQRITFGKDTGDITLAGDFDGDGIADIAIRRSTNKTWYVQNSSGVDEWTGHEDGISRITFGTRVEDIPVPADYDGDGISDIAVRRPSSRYWYIKNSSGIDPITNNPDGITRFRFGNSSSDIPVPADYDGDGKADLAVWRPKSQMWYVLNSSGTDPLTNNEDGISRLALGAEPGDIPVPADYDGDGRADLAIRSSGTFFWTINNSTGLDVINGSEDGVTQIQFGMKSEDIPVVADYDGDGLADIAVRRPSNHFWYIRNSSGEDVNEQSRNGVQRHHFGKNSYDIPIAAPISTKLNMLR